MSESPLRDGSLLIVHDAPGPVPGIDSDRAGRHATAENRPKWRLRVTTPLARRMLSISSPVILGLRAVGARFARLRHSSRSGPDSAALTAPASPEKRGPRLPQELADLILDFLWEFDNHLHTCMLVCRAWHLYVVRRGLLAGTLRLATASALASLVKSLPAETARLREVHTAILTDAPPDAAPWLHRAAPQLGSALHGVTRLFLNDWRPARAPLHPLTFPAFSQFRVVVKLYLMDCAFASAVQLQRLLVEFPQLRELGLVGVYIPKARSGTARQRKPPPRLEWLWLGNSRKARPGEDEENVAGCLAEWFARDEARLGELSGFFLELNHDVLREGELASLGRLVEVVGPRIQLLALNFIDPPSDPLDPAALWHELKLERCMSVRTLRVYRSTPALHELALLSPECRVRVLQLRRWEFLYEQKTDWAVLATALEGDVFADLQKVVNARSLRSGETSELEAFVGRMRARSVVFEDRTESAFWDQ